MSRNAFVLVEGQTEERFVKDVLAPEFYAFDFFFHPRLLVTKRVKQGASFKGGVTSYGKYRNDATRLLAEAKGQLVTTILDYFGLPADFPGMFTRPAGKPIDRARHVERQIFEDLGSPPNFIPFLALHEFEAWLFTSRDVLPATMSRPDLKGEFTQIRDSFDDPECINEGPQTAPSKRILKLFPAYRKVLHGPLVVGRIGTQAIRDECPHFNEWYGTLEQIALRSQR